MKLSLREFQRHLKRDLKRLKRGAEKAIDKTAHKAVAVVQGNAPKAFGELAYSVHAEDHKTVVSAPHAQAVEIGSRPHVVPLEDLVAWVKLRGMQGLSKTGRVRSSSWQAKGSGASTAMQARRVARGLKALERNNALGVDAPEKIAKAIQLAIAENGTKPHWFVRESLPEVAEILDRELRKVFK